MSEEIRILKTASCSSLSGRSTLTYDIGCNSHRSVYLRLSENTGKGIFSKVWIPLAQLDPLLASEEKPITSGVILKLYKGKSVNTAGFIIAVLISEGLLKVSKESLRSYERNDSSEFNQNIQKLMDADNEKHMKAARVKKMAQSDKTLNQAKADC